jgi:hypothetical protein
VIRCFPDIPLYFCKYLVDSSWLQCSLLLSALRARWQACVLGHCSSNLKPVNCDSPGGMKTHAEHVVASRLCSALQLVCQLPTHWSACVALYMLTCRRSLRGMQHSNSSTVGCSMGRQRGPIRARSGWRARQRVREASSKLSWCHPVVHGVAVGVCAGWRSALSLAGSSWKLCRANSGWRAGQCLRKASSKLSCCGRGTGRSASALVGNSWQLFEQQLARSEAAGAELSC